MTTVNNFERATRISLRFNTSKGQQPAEVLWSMPMLPRSAQDEFCLENVAQTAASELAGLGAQSFVKKAGASDRRRETAELRMEIIKHIIATRQAEEEAVAMSAMRKQEAARIEEIIAHKKDTALTDLSLEELEARRNALLAV